MNGLEQISISIDFKIFCSIFKNLFMYILQSKNRGFQFWSNSSFCLLKNIIQEHIIEKTFILILTLENMANPFFKICNVPQSWTSVKNEGICKMYKSKIYPTEYWIWKHVNKFTYIFFTFKEVSLRSLLAPTHIRLIFSNLATSQADKWVEVHKNKNKRSCKNGKISKIK